MWKTVNTTNILILEAYNRLVIEKFFDFWMLVSSSGDKDTIIASRDTLCKAFTSIGMDERFLDLKLHKGDVLLTLMQDIINLGTPIIQNELNIFKKQNAEVKSGNYGLTKTAHPAELKKIFIDYFYGDFFGVKWIWEDFLGIEYSRKVFTRNFQSDSDITVCPYCDIDTIVSDGSSEIDHFLPKSIFPYLACNSLNLLPACKACNGPQGKGTRILNLITNPYLIQVGDRLTFQQNGPKIDLLLTPSPEINNYVSLFKLKERYGNKHVSKVILNQLKADYNIYQQTGQTKKDFYSYLEIKGRNSGFYFALKSLLDDLP